MKTKILLLAHDSLQDQLSEFIIHHESTLRPFQLISNHNEQKFLKLIAG